MMKSREKYERSSLCGLILVLWPLPGVLPELYTGFPVTADGCMKKSGRIMMSAV